MPRADAPRSRPPARSAPAAARTATGSTAILPRRRARESSLTARGHLRLSKALIEQRGDRGFPGVADGAALLGGALEDDQCRLHLGAELPDHRLHLVEIDAEDFQILELRIGGQLLQDRILRL